AQTVASVLERHAAMGKIDEEDLAQALQELQFPDLAIAIFNSHGRLLAEKTAAGQNHVRLPSAGPVSESAEIFYSLPERSPESDDSCRGVIQRIRLSPTKPPQFIVVNQSLERLGDQLDALENILFAAVPIALTLTGLGGWFLARRSLAPVMAISQQAQQIGVKNLDQRLRVVNATDELGRLATTFNELFDRLSKSFA